MLEPYYDDGEVTLYLGDCLDEDIVLKWAGVGAADVLVTDPPYGVAYVSNSSKYGSTKPIVGDDNAEVRDHALLAWQGPDVLLNGAPPRPGLVFGAWNIPRPWFVRHRLIWDKGDSPGMGDLSLPWGKGDEEIYVIGQGFAGPRTSNVIRAKGYGSMDPRRPKHPTPKPVALMEALIAKCPPGVVADPFAGSGATLIAARNLGRRAVGVEFDEEYCDMIARRLSQQTFGFDFGDE